MMRDNDDCHVAETLAPPYYYYYYYYGFTEAQTIGNEWSERKGEVR